MIDDDVTGRLVALHDHIEAPVTAPDADVVRGKQALRRRRAALAGATAAIVAAVLATMTAVGTRGGEQRPVGPDYPAPDTGTNGWIAVGATLGDDEEIQLFRPGQGTRPLEVTQVAGATEACPAWSPDGTRLMFGRLVDSGESLSGSDAELVIVPVRPDGTTGTPQAIGLDGFVVHGGFDPHPCATWAPDGRWAALRGTGEVWVVDTRTGDIRRLPGLRPSDLEWRPGTDELTIAGDLGTDRGEPTVSAPVTVYSVSTGQLTRLGAIEAAHVTWSPDGSSLAFTGGETDPSQLWLVDADGTSPRLLVDHLAPANHGIGPVWSPAGNLIAHQRRISSGELHDVVLIDVRDGTQTIIEPPVTEPSNGSGGADEWAWYPSAVSWSPDGEALLYSAWVEDVDDPGDIGGGVIAVPARASGEPTVLLEGRSFALDSYSHQWAPLQVWGRQTE